MAYGSFCVLKHVNQVLLYLSTDGDRFTHDVWRDTASTRPPKISLWHYNDVIMSTMTSQITSLTIVYSTVYPGVDQRKLQRSASLAFVRGIHRWPVNSPHKGTVTRKCLAFQSIKYILDMFSNMLLREIYDKLLERYHIQHKLLGLLPYNDSFHGYSGTWQIL